MKMINAASIRGQVKLRQGRGVLKGGVVDAGRGGKGVDVVNTRINQMMLRSLNLKFKIILLMQAELTDFLLRITFQKTLLASSQSFSLLSTPQSPSQQILASIYRTLNSGKNSKPMAEHKSSFCSDQSTVQPTLKCSCVKSKCLKLYCQCFSRGSFCKDCNCDCCFNKQQFIEIRARAIDELIVKTQIPFGSKTMSVKGCNCKKTGCQKKYCECYNQGMGCNQYCKCMNCLNIAAI